MVLLLMNTQVINNISSTDHHRPYIIWATLKLHNHCSPPLETTTGIHHRTNKKTTIELSIDTRADAINFMPAVS